MASSHQIWSLTTAADRSPLVDRRWLICPSISTSWQIAVGWSPLVEIDRQTAGSPLNCVLTLHSWTSFYFLCFVLRQQFGQLEARPIFAFVLACTLHLQIAFCSAWSQNWCWWSVCTYFRLLVVINVYVLLCGPPLLFRCTLRMQFQLKIYIWVFMSSHLLW